jgi:hypothetical protein
VGRIAEEALQGEGHEILEEGPAQAVRILLEPAQDLVPLMGELAEKERPYSSVASSSRRSRPSSKSGCQERNGPVSRSRST